MRQMKSLIYFYLCFSMLFISIAQADVNANLNVDDNRTVQFQLPEGWTKNTNKSSYDIQFTSAKKRMNTGVFLYKKADLPDKYQNAEKLLNFQADDLSSRRQNVKVIEAQRTIPFANGTIITKSFAADKKKKRNHYTISVIQLKQADDIFLTTIQVTLPKVWGENKSVQEGILQSAKLRK